MDKPEDKLKVKPKRVETLTERFERLHHMYDDGPEPKHLNDKSIVDMEKWNSMKGLEKKTPVRPKPFKNDDPSTYPSNQKKTMDTWELMMEKAKNPKTKDDRIEAKEVRQTIYKNYKDPTQRKYLGDDELKLIGKHKSQQVYPKIEIPIIGNYKPFVREVGPSLDEVLSKKTRVKPGLSEDLLGMRSDINKNVKYVLGDKKENQSESKNEKNQTNNEEKPYDR
tara:strand:+ start:799 stop:1467 length:669 start_codon:yes stop_codon:yes gene_type:complete